MENLKRKILTLIFILISISASPQSLKSIVDLFSKSYEAENAKNYVIAIEKLKAGYDPDNYIINIRLGWLCYLAKQYTESIVYYQKSIALKPNAIEPRFGCVKPLSALEEWDKVKKQYFEILTIDPQNTVANYWLGLIYYNRKDYGNALKLFEKIVNLYPLDYDSLIMLAWSNLYSNKPNEAKVLFGQALIIRPDDSSAMAGLKLLSK